MTTLSGSALPFVKGFDDYVSKAAAHDQTRPGGASERVEYQSCLGDCQPESFVGDLLRTRLAYGKADLEIDAYSYVLSHSHEELDPADDSLGVVAHGLAREWAREAWPGRQVKIVTQRDNGRWEEDEHGERVWVEGKWHSHIVVANVAEQAVELKWTDADGIEKTKSYKPGRAIDGDLKNIFRLRHITDAVVLREWKYDNQAYVEACRQFAAGAASKQDLAQRAERGYSTYDEVRAKLRTAAAQATSWDDYTARCQAAAVDVATRGKSGVSYAWIDDAGLERKARARGKAGIGPEFTRAGVEKQCEENAQALACGERLEAPDEVLVVPTSTVAPDRPRPVYLTPDGKPPWGAEDALAAYAARVRETGGTYEGRVAQALVSGEPVAGVELPRGTASTTATVDAGYGPVAVDLETGIAAQAVEVANRAIILEEIAAEQENLQDRREAALDDREDRVRAAEADWEENVKPELGKRVHADATAALDEALQDTLVDLEAANRALRGSDVSTDAIRARYADAPLQPGGVPRRIEVVAGLAKAAADARQAEIDAEWEKVTAFDRTAVDKHASAEFVRQAKNVKLEDGRTAYAAILDRVETSFKTMHPEHRKGLDLKTFATETIGERQARRTVGTKRTHAVNEERKQVRAAEQAAHPDSQRPKPRGQ